MKTILGPVESRISSRKDLDEPTREPVAEALYGPRPNFVEFLENETRERLLGRSGRSDVLRAVGNEKSAKTLYGQWRCNYHVKTVASLTPDQASRLLFGTDELGNNSWWFRSKPATLEVVLSYPLSVNVEVSIGPSRDVKEPSDRYPVDENKIYNSFGLFLLALAKEYERIYAEDDDDPEKYGIWGHHIGDLYFERVTVHKDGTAYVFIGS